MEWIKGLKDAEVISRLEAVTGAQRRQLPVTLALIAEVDRRKLYQEFSFNSTFEYCTVRLKLSEDEAYRRIHAARQAVLYPEIYQRLRDGSLSLTAVARLAPHLTPENAVDLVAKAAGLRRRGLEELVASLQESRPLPPDRVRPLLVDVPVAPIGVPGAATEADLFSAVPPSATAPEMRYEYTVVISAEMREALDRLREILASKYPFGRLEDFLREAVQKFLQKHDPLRAEARESGPANDEPPGSGGRYVPRAVRDAVWARDGGRCTFVSPDGRRCECRRALQIDHIVPFSEGGKATLSNLRLLCPEHNQLERRRKLGEGRRVLGDGPRMPRASLKLLKEESAQLPLPS